MKLTDAAIRRAASRTHDYKLGDGGGLYLLIRPNGSRLWCLKYRFAGREKKTGPAPRQHPGTGRSVL